MSKIQLSVSQRAIHGEPKFYHFLFRTEWLEYDEGVRLCELFLERFTAPEFKVTLKERETNMTSQDLN